MKKVSSIGCVGTAFHLEQIVVLLGSFDFLLYNCT